MFTHPEHIIDIHKRQIIEATREHNHGGNIPANAAPKERPTKGRTLFGRFRTMMGGSTAPKPTLSTQK